MTMDDFFQNVQIAIKKVFPEADISTVSPATLLRDDLGADSMGNISLLLELEDQFGASLPSEEARNVMNVGQIVDVIDTQLKQEFSPTLIHL